MHHSSDRRIVHCQNDLLIAAGEPRRGSDKVFSARNVPGEPFGRKREIRQSLSESQTGFLVSVPSLLLRAFALSRFRAEKSVVSIPIIDRTARAARPGGGGTTSPDASC